MSILDSKNICLSLEHCTLGSFLEAGMTLLVLVLTGAHSIEMNYLLIIWEFLLECDLDI